ncbi:hypothetical protein ACIRU3_38425 [Streptomyces sp. NPDC101151]|uniref:hypothetical protein n=1 Tax=Streptomyces sp. NPDC101151 TaxID=3366115 RepID=UPI0037F44D60
MSKNQAWRRPRQGLTLVTSAFALVVGLATSSSAETWPTTAEIMADCQSGLGKCTFGDTGPVAGSSGPGDSVFTKRHYYGNFAKVSPEFPNCTPLTQRNSVGWSHTTGTSNTIGVSVRTSVTLAKIFEVSVETKYEHEWMVQDTEAGTYNVDTPPGYIGWVERQQVMNDFYGKWRTHYDDPKWGHYYWATPYDHVYTPAREGEDGLYSNVGQKVRPMTPEELSSRCGWRYPSQAIKPGTTLRAGWETRASLTRLTMQSDGNLVMYRLRDNKALWSTRTYGHPGAYAVMQKDGNFVIYDAANRFLWNSNTADYPGAYALMQNDGEFVIYCATGGPDVGSGPEEERGIKWRTYTAAAARG